VNNRLSERQVHFLFSAMAYYILAHRTNGRACTIKLRPSVVCRPNVCIVAKRCVLEQKLLFTAYKKSHRLVST